MISALSWIPKGAAKEEPEQAELTAEELEAMKAAADEDAADEEVRGVRRAGLAAAAGSGGCVTEYPAAPTSSASSWPRACAQDAGSETSDEEQDSESDMEAAGEGEEEDEAAAVARARAVAAALKSNQGESGAPSAGGDSLAAAMAELDMEHYDSEDDGGAAARILGGSGNPGESSILHSVLVDSSAGWQPAPPAAAARRCSPAVQRQPVRALCDGCRWRRAPGWRGALLLAERGVHGSRAAAACLALAASIARHRAAQCSWEGKSGTSLTRNHARTHAHSVTLTRTHARTHIPTCRHGLFQGPYRRPAAGWQLRFGHGQ